MAAAAPNLLESLSNEILLDIFEYLDAYHMCQAWYGLNTRINSLLQSTQLYTYYDKSIDDKTIWNTMMSFYNSSQIYVLCYFRHINCVQQIWINSMENLHILHL